nr:uncharacterized protein LOC109192575 isoform X1 [Ipomoea batatas]
MLCFNLLANLDFHGGRDYLSDPASRLPLIFTLILVEAGRKTENILAIHPGVAFLEASALPPPPATAKEDEEDENFMFWLYSSTNNFYNIATKLEGSVIRGKNAGGTILEGSLTEIGIFLHERRLVAPTRSLPPALPRRLPPQRIKLTVDRGVVAGFRGGFYSARNPQLLPATALKLLRYWKFVNTVRGSEFLEISLDDLAIELFSQRDEDPGSSNLKRSRSARRIDQNWSLG